MEKFTSFRDKGTGISPFLPIPDPDSNKPLIKYIVKPLTFLLKLPFLLVSTLSLLLISPLGFLFKPLLHLYLIAFFNLSQIELLVDGVKKSNLSVIDSKRPQPDDIVFINFSSPLDSLILYITSNSQSCDFYSIDSKGNLFIVGSPLDCSRFALTAPSKRSPVPLKINRKGKVAFVIVEGTTTNNRSIMRFPERFNLREFVQVNRLGHVFKTLSIKVYPGAFFTTPLPESVAKFVYDTVSDFRSDLKYRMKVFEMGDSEGISEHRIRTDLSNYGKMKLLGEHLDLEKKGEFIASY
ncbi:DEKNAAC105207 [Brettanomyces naardenensis]|uniref:DEKNAAC105207 n=1 Tax=Brettanomyces naardenensis TaxID=13370 RepID=A0A448YSQ0_BRENA|nr:DEKNAAC105207 [Brettanomyces naardenensis]